MPLQTVLRPKELDQFFGSDNIKESLDSVLSREKDIPHAFLFTGPAGCGKTTLARIVKDRLGCSDLDYTEIDAASDRSVESIRNLRQGVALAPMMGKVKVLFFDEFHGLATNKVANEALLKLLEDPPPHVFIILATTETDKVSQTIKRRCHHYEIKPLNTQQMTKFLKSILSNEGIEVDDDLSKVITKIVQVSNGSPGIALKHLDSIIDMQGLENMISLLEGNTFAEKSVLDICQTLLDPKLNQVNKWKALSQMIPAISGEPESTRRGILGYLEKVLLSKPSESVAAMITCFSNNLYDTGRPGLTLSIYLASQQ